MQTILNTILLAALCLPANGQTVSDTIKHNPMTETDVKLSEVVVTGLTGNQRLRQSPAPVSFISSRQLEAQPSLNIIDAIARQPGVSQVTTGSGISKPVIRGLGYNRVVVVSDGIRQEGQQWGDEHGIEVDQNAVGSVEILKGPASLMYGSDAMAGVIIFRQQPVMMEGDMKAQLSAGYQTNSGLLDYSLNFAGNRRGFVWNSRYSQKLAHAYKNRYDGYVFGSSYREQAFSQMLGFNGRLGFSHLTLSYYHLTPGIVEGERDEDTGQLLVPDGYSLKSYGHAMPYQQIRHYKAVADNQWHIGDGNLKLLLGYQQNRRQEFEEEDNPTQCGLDFMLHTVNYDLHYLSPDVSGWKFQAGVGGMWQRSLNKGSEYLVPAYRLFDCGVFLTASKAVGRMSFSGGVRADRRQVRGFRLIDDGEERFSAFSRSFGAVTGSLGMAYEATEQLNLKLNVSRGFRAPNISELASNGVHEGTQRYEMGNTQLKPEGSWQADLGIDYTSSLWSAQLSLFANRIGDYIYIRKLASADGGEQMADGVPAYRFTAADARLMGGEARVDVHPLRHLHIGNSFSYVNAVRLNAPADEKYLPFTPAPRWCADVKYEFVCGGHTFDNLFLKAALDCNLRQSHVLTANDTETPTPSYTLLHLYAGTDIVYRGSRLLSVYLSAENITDRTYQNHLSRLKYLDRNNATGRRGVYNPGRTFSLKVVMPLAL